MKSADMEILQTFSGKIKEKRDLSTKSPFSLNRLSLFIVFLFLTVLGLLFLGKTSYAEENEGHRLKSYYSLYYKGIGFQSYSNDAQRQSRNDVYPTGVKICLKHQPEGMSGTIQYQANISGSGWSNTYENGQAIGEGQEMPLEGIRVFLNGDLKEKYDVYYRTLVLGEWQPWAKNGEDSNPVGVGKHIDGILITVVAKGEAPVEEKAAVEEKVAGNGEKSGIDPSKPMVALTFDDGPGNYEDRILTALQKNNARATFFYVGTQATKFPSVVKRVAEAGNEIGNHSYKHENLPKLSEGAIEASINKTNEILRQHSGQSVRLVRPPYGATAGSVKPALKATGQPSILWSIDTLDWKTKNTHNTVNVVLTQVKDGDIILMHSIYKQSAEAAEQIIPALKERGYQLVTVSELAKARGINMEAGKNYGSFRPKK